MKNILKGGLSDNLTLKDLSLKHNVPIKELSSQLQKGIEVEKEHTNNINKATEIAMDHLTEDPKYYDKLKKIEMDEVTDASSSGAFDVPFNSQNKKNPLKIDGVKSINKSRAVVDKTFPKWGGPGGIYVKIKDKCKKFPYCNQGDENTIEILENNKLMEEISKDFKINTTTLKKIILKETMKPYKKYLNNIIKEEVNKQILSEQTIGNEDVFNIVCDGKLVDSFSDEKQANDELNKYKKSHPSKNFTLEKGEKKSFDELDEMCDDINEEENMENEINPLYTHFAIDKNSGKIVNGWEYDKDMDKESIADYCKIDIKDMGLKPKNIKVVTKKFLITKDINPFDVKNWSNLHDLDSENNLDENICEDCKKQTCECDKTMNENKEIKKKIVLKESELINLIEKILNEDVPNLKEKNKSINKTGINDTSKKIKDYLKFDGNTNPEFPKSNTSDKIKKVNNTKEEDEIVSDNRGKGTQDLIYDNEPRKEFKERLKKSLKGDSTMGNSQDSLNVVKSDTGDKMIKNSEKRTKIKKEEPLYKKEKVPVKK